MFNNQSASDLLLLDASEQMHLSTDASHLLAVASDGAFDAYASVLSALDRTA